MQGLGGSKRDGGFFSNGGQAIFRKYSPDQPRSADGRWIGAFDIFSGATRANGPARKPSGATMPSHSLVAVNIGVGGEGGKDDTPEEELTERIDGEGPTGRTNHGRTLTPGVPAAGGYGAPASSFAGSSRLQLQSPAGAPPRNDPTTVDGIPYSGHALDQMQNRGLFPSVTGQAIQTGLQGPGNWSGTNVFYDPVNNVSVVRDNTTGNVITVIPGDNRKGPK